MSLSLLLPVLAATLAHAATTTSSSWAWSSTPAWSSSAAAYTSASSYSAPPSASPMVHQVSVGPNSELVFDPPYLEAQVGDSIEFTFNPKNHSVTQSSFDSPCSPLAGGFNSGFRPVAAGVTYGLPTFTVPVKDNNPIWIHCAQQGPPVHCSQGMVFAANAPATGNTFAAFKAKALALNASSTSTSASSTYSASASATPMVHQVDVGLNGQLKYSPEYIVAAPGDKVQFTFHQKNHTVTQAAFASPCSPLSGGFNSGFNPVAADVTSNFPTFNITVNDTKPIWAYCAQQGPPVHCTQGMVFAVNPPATGNTFAAFLAEALALNASSSSSWSSSAGSSSTYWSSSAGSSSTYQYGGANPTQTYSAQPTYSPVTHYITVGGDNNVYTPNTVDANPGDTVRFVFHVKNHTVTQSPFNDPCTKLENATYGKQIGFDSGFMPVESTDLVWPSFSVKINDTTPVWGYCRQTGHCQSGMVFGINAPKTGPHTIEAFIQLAQHSNATTLSANYSSTAYQSGSYSSYAAAYTSSGTYSSYAAAHTSSGTYSSYAAAYSSLAGY